METIDIELSELASRLIGEDVEVVWNNSKQWLGRAVTGPHHYYLELNNSLKRVDGAERLAVILHELAHLHLGHTMTPDRFRKSKYANVPRAQLAADDTGQATHLRREIEAWTQAAAWAMVADRRDAALYCKRRREQDFLNYVAGELANLNKRIERLEVNAWQR